MCPGHCGLLLVRLTVRVKRKENGQGRNQHTAWPRKELRKAGEGPDQETPCRISEDKSKLGLHTRMGNRSPGHPERLPSPRRPRDLPGQQYVRKGAQTPSRGTAQDGTLPAWPRLGAAGAELTLVLSVQNARAGEI